MVNLDGSFEYQSECCTGAVIITQDVIQGEDAEREGLYLKYIMKHFKSWHIFAEEKGYLVTQEELELASDL